MIGSSKSCDLFNNECTLFQCRVCSKAKTACLRDGHPDPDWSGRVIQKECAQIPDLCMPKSALK